MPTLTTSIEDTSPVIVYSQSNGYQSWRAGSSKTDASLDSYSSGSYMVTNASQASVSFSFYGTGVQLFGSKRQGHGFYQISIDSLVYPQVNGGVNDTQGQFNVQLFSTVALAAGYHTVKMTNLGTGDLDLDYLTWQTPIGEVEDTLRTITLQDTDPAFTYNPSANWFNTPANLGFFSGGTGHATSIAGSWLELKFTGDAIALYGPLTPNGPAYTVSLDGQASGNYSSASQAIYRPQQLLYQAGNLQGKEHTLKVQTEDNTSGSQFVVDYALVYSTSTAKSTGPSLSTGAIIGAALGSFFLLVIIIVALFFGFRCWSRYRKYGKIAVQQPRSDSEPRHTLQPYQQGPTTYADSSNSHSRLIPSTSYVSMRSDQQQSTSSSTNITPPSTAAPWSPPPGTRVIYSTISDPFVAGPNKADDLQAQVVTVPFTPGDKYRPDLSSPTLDPAPQQARSSILAAGPSHYIGSPNYSEGVSAEGQPSPNAPLHPLRPGEVTTGTWTPPAYQSGNPF
ncbi:hypothetical protein CPB83DRAFT_887409 [Crepidotus variabilis]|uniref:Transmembrane protein n=1 Tax=Crepidotus variabilis TaxID=179855 RepID=A0A9P6JJ86_9AGAR|nr:hypothetical protein CPB83DRAFT_887409 [Crepidotus variabilis]